MSDFDDLYVSLCAQGRDIGRVEAELGALAAELARIALEVRELREALLPVARSSRIN
jgi:hypothetical protein